MSWEWIIAFGAGCAVTLVASTWYRQALAGADERVAVIVGDGRRGPASTGSRPERNGPDAAQAPLHGSKMREQRCRDRQAEDAGCLAGRRYPGERHGKPARNEHPQPLPMGMR